MCHHTFIMSYMEKNKKKHNLEEENVINLMWRMIQMF